MWVAQQQMDERLKIVSAPTSMPTHKSYGSKFHFVRRRVSSNKVQLPDLSFINRDDPQAGSESEMQQFDLRGRQLPPVVSADLRDESNHRESSISRSQEENLGVQKMALRIYAFFDFCLAIND